MADNSPQVAKGQQFQEMADNSPQVVKGQQLQVMTNNSPKVQAAQKLQTMVDNAPVKTSIFSSKSSGITDFLWQHAQPKIDTGAEKVKVLGAAQRKTKPATTKLKESKAAVKTPANQHKADAKKAQIKTVASAKPPIIQEKKAKLNFGLQLKSILPKNLDEMDLFKKSGKAKTLLPGIKDILGSDTKKVRSTFGAIKSVKKTKQKANKTSQLPPIEGAESIGALNLSNDLLPDIPKGILPLDQYKAEGEALLQGSEITQEHLDMVDSGELFEAKKLQEKLEGTTEHAEGEIAATKNVATAELTNRIQSKEKQERKGMEQTRQGGLSEARKEQTAATGTFEDKKARVVQEIEGRYNRLEKSISTRLDALENNSLQQFNTGVEKATTTFEDNVKRRLDAFKAKRYEGAIAGNYYWYKDKLLGIDKLPAVKEILSSERTTYEQTIHRNIAAISLKNAEVIATCQKDLADGRKDIEDYVAGLSPKLREAASTALKAIQAKLDALAGTISEKETALQQMLQDKTAEAIKKIETRIEEIKEDNQGAINQFGDYVKDGAVKILRWMAEKAGLNADELLAVINKGKETLMQIIENPVGFFNNLVSAAENGFNSFQSNIGEHLEGGLLGWLTGAMSGAGIQMPETFDMQGVFSMASQVLGFTWDAIRDQLVDELGEENVSRAEKFGDVLKTVMTEGVSGLWEEIKDKVSGIKDSIMEEIKSWTLTKIIQVGITKLLLMMNPAGAAVQGIKMVYDSIMFFMNEAERIKDLVATITNSIADIAAGKVDTAAKYITESLIRTVPVVLSFLSYLLSLNKITEAIRKAIDKVRAPIEKAIRKGVEWLVGKVKKWLKDTKQYIKKRNRKPKKVAETSTKDKAKDKAKHGEKDEKSNSVDKASDWINMSETFEDETGHVHTLFFKGNEDNAQLMVASVPKKVHDFIKEVMGRLDTDERKEVQDEVQEINSSETTIEKNVRKLRKELSDKEEDKAERIISKEVKTIQQEFIEFFLDAKNFADYPDEVKEYLATVNNETKTAVKKELEGSNKEPIRIQNNSGEGNNVAKNKASIYIQNHSGSGDNILTETASLFIQQNHTGSGDNVANGNTSKYIQQNHSGSGDNVAGKKIVNNDSKDGYTWNFSMDGEPHTIFVVKNGDKFDVLMASKRKRKVEVKQKELMHEINDTIKRYKTEYEETDEPTDEKEFLKDLNEIKDAHLPKITINIDNLLEAVVGINNGKERAERITNEFTIIEKLVKDLIVELVEIGTLYGLDDMSKEAVQKREQAASDAEELKQKEIEKAKILKQKEAEKAERHRALDIELSIFGNINLSENEKKSLIRHLKEISEANKFERLKRKARNSENLVKDKDRMLSNIMDSSTYYVTQIEIEDGTYLVQKTIDGYGGQAVAETLANLSFRINVDKRLNEVRKKLSLPLNIKYLDYRNDELSDSQKEFSTKAIREGQNLKKDNKQKIGGSTVAAVEMGTWKEVLYTAPALFVSGDNRKSYKYTDKGEEKETLNGDSTLSEFTFPIYEEGAHGGPRATDTEVKIFEHLLKVFKNKKSLINQVKVIRLFIRYPACASCQNVMTQLKKRVEEKDSKYSALRGKKVEVIHGNEIFK